MTKCSKERKQKNRKTEKQKNRKTEKQKNRKTGSQVTRGWIIVYIVFVIALGLVGLIPLGYSEQGNEPVSINYSLDESNQETVQISSRNFSESYDLTVTDNVWVNGFQIIFSAADENFKGILTASITGKDGEVDRTTVDLASTGSKDSFITVNASFIDIDTRNIAVHLWKGHPYTLNLQIDTNMPGYFIKKFDVSNVTSSLYVEANGKSTLSSITYTSLTPMRYWNAFCGFILLLIFLNGYFLLNRLGFGITKNEKVKKFLAFLQDHYSGMILLLTFLFLALYEFYFAYVKGTYISPDSSHYLQEANAILNGYGFNEVGQSGYISWFAAWPIGYPALIAAIAFIIGKNVYLASKILSIVFVGIILLLVYLRFRKQAWIFTFCLFNVGFLNIYKYTWSENPFILGLLMFCLSLEQIIKQDRVKIRWFVFCGLSSAFLFLCRYFGAFSLISIGSLFLYYFCSYIYCRKRGFIAEKHKMQGCFLSGIISGVFASGYAFINYFLTGEPFGVSRRRFWENYSTLTDNYYKSLVAEVGNAFRIVLPETLSNVSWMFHVFVILLVLLVFIYLIRKYRSKDYKTIFICFGLFYYAIFTFVRYHSSMDPFGSRFFAPASMLITIGLSGYLAPFLNRHKNQIAPVVIGALVIMVAGLSYNLKDFDRKNTAYAQLQDSLKSSVQTVPEHSVILGSTELDYRTRLARPDLYLTEGIINPTDTIDLLFERWSQSDYICIKAKHIKNILNYPVYDYESSVVDFFSEMPEDTPDEQFLVISVKDRKLVPQSP